MTRQLRPDPVTRWAEAEPGSELDAELGEVFRSLQGSEPMPHASLAAVGRRIAQRRKPAARRPLRLLPLVLAVLTCSAGAAFAKWAHDGGFHLQQLLARVTQHRESEIKPSIALRRSEPVSLPSLPSAVPVAVPLPGAQPEAPRSAAPPPASARPSALALESEVLQKALAKLRREHDSAGALSLLDEYQTRFPKGVLSLEAAVARVDALLMAGRRAEALERLSRLPLERVGRRVELQLLRAELRAERDCPRALSDFSSVLRAAPSGAFAERALYGRATCRLRSGDEAGGRADLAAYLAQFPRGRFAAQVRSRAQGR